MTDTKRAPITFTVKEGDAGTPFLAIEYLRIGNLPPSFTRQMLTFDLTSGTDYAGARSLADALNEKIENLAVTAL